MITVASLVALVASISVSARAEQVFSKIVLDSSTGAVCLDGSPAVVYVSEPPAAAEHPPSILLFLQGGGWCATNSSAGTLTACEERAHTRLGSSKSYGPTFTPSYEGGNGLLFNDTTINPTFGSGFIYVYAMYCDGASFAGDVAEPNNETSTTMYFRGHRILDTIFELLESKLGLGRAPEAVLAGCSAGGLATYIHCDRFASAARAAAVRAGRQPSDIKTRCIADAGYFPDFVAQPLGSSYISQRYHQVALLQNTTGHTNDACEAASAPGEEWRCFFPEVTAPYLTTPIFALNSGYDRWQMENIWFALAPAGSAWAACAGNLSACEGAQLSALRGFHEAFVDDKLKVILDPASPHGAFIDSCRAHCQSGVTWTKSVSLRGMTIAQTVDAWYSQGPSAATKRVMAPFDAMGPGSYCTST